MPTTSDGRRMQLDPHILDFLKALEAQGVPPLWGHHIFSGKAYAKLAYMFLDMCFS